jgi:hypothetical protein
MICAQLKDSTRGRSHSFNRKNIHEEEVLTSHEFSSIGESELSWLAWKISSMMQLEKPYLRADDACAHASLALIERIHGYCRHTT